MQMEHRSTQVQIFDPSTGTGTFLPNVVKTHHKKLQGQQGIFGANYVETHYIATPKRF